MHENRHGRSIGSRSRVGGGVDVAALVTSAVAAIDRILGEDSELRELWEDGADEGKWRAGVADLRKRVLG